MDAQEKAKAKGADVLKQWDSTMDGATRPIHRRLDGQIREVDEPFEMGGKKAMYPGGFGDPAEDCNCRCASLTRARWGLDEAELQTLKDRAAYFGLDKTEDFNDFKTKYLKAAKEPLENTEKSGRMKVDIQLFADKTKHAAERAVQRDVSDSAIDDALKNPLFTGEVVTDDQGRKSVKLIGREVTVIQNPDSEEVITTWKTSARIRKKYEGGD